MPASSHRHQATTVAALAAICCVGAVLRFAWLPQRGLLYWDEGKFALEGIRMQVLLQDLFGGHHALTLGKAVGTAKPTHALLIAFSYFLFGVHDYSALFLNAAASVLCVLAVFAIAARLFSAPAGLGAALLFAVSEYDVVYARSALSESDAEVIFLIGVYGWVRGMDGDRTIPSRQRVLFAAVLGGLSFTANYRMLVYLAVLVGFDLVLRWMRLGTARSVSMAGVWALGLVAVPLLWEAIDVVVRSQGLVLFQNEVARHPSSYLAQAAYQIHEGKQSVVRFLPLAYPEWYIVRQGPWSILLLVAALGMALVRRSVNLLLPAAFVLIPYLLFIIAPFVVPRNMNVAVAFASILVAGALFAIPGTLRLPAISWLTAALILLATAGMDFALAWRVTAVRSGLAPAARYIMGHGSRGAIVANEVSVFYFRGGAGPCLGPRVPYTVKQLGADVQWGFRWAVLDRSSGSPIDGFIARRIRPAASWPDEGNVSLGENLIDSENTLTPDTQRSAGVVRVYDLARLHLPLQAHPRRPGCNREYPP